MNSAALQIYSFSLSYLIYFVLLLTCVYCIFRLIFKFVLPCLFSKLWLSLLLNIQNNEKNYKVAESKEAKKKKFNSKKWFGKESFMMSAKPSKSLNFRPQLTNPPLAHPGCPKLAFKIPPSRVIFFENFNNEINIVA